MPRTPTHDVPSDLLTIPEAALLARVNERTVRRWIERGMLTVYGRLKAYRVSASEVVPIARHSLNPHKRSQTTKRPGSGHQNPPGMLGKRR